MLRIALDLVLPPRCPGCGAIVDADHRFCSACWMQLEFITDRGCVRCNVPLGVGDDLICGPCLADPPRHDGVRAAVVYGDVSRRVALRLKHARRPGLAHTMAGLLAVHVDPVALLVPVPLHRWRIWSRGFNQALAIARALNRVTDAPCDIDLLIRRRATPSLRGLDPGQRKRAVRGAFIVTRRLEGGHVQLVDDVYTTGATANACAAALKRAGAERVTVLAWARVLDSD